MTGFDYVWVWKPHPDEPWMTQLDRRWERCRVIARGSMNSALIEFERDGFRTVASRNGLQRAITPATEHDLRQVLVDLELISHVSAVNYGGSERDQGEDIGGRRPPGGVDRRDDLPDNHERSHRQKSAEHFRRRLRNVHTQRRAELVLDEARTALNAWRRQPPPSEQPEISSPSWKRWVGESALSASEVARKSGCTRQYVDKIRAQYREAA